MQTVLHVVSRLVNVSAARKALLFVDKCAAYPPNTLFLRNVKISFLPASCASMLQPLSRALLGVCWPSRKPLVQKK